MASGGGSSVQWRGASRDLVSRQYGYWCTSECSSLLAEVTGLIVQRGGGRIARTKGADRQALRHPGTPRCRRGHRCGGPGRGSRLRVSRSSRLGLPSSLFLGQEGRPDRGRWHLVAKQVGRGELDVVAGWLAGEKRKVRWASQGSSTHYGNNYLSWWMMRYERT